jgi:hypothetical protein
MGQMLNCVYLGSARVLPDLRMGRAFAERESMQTAYRAYLRWCDDFFFVT